jgi:hypothetical protein
MVAGDSDPLVDLRRRKPWTWGPLELIRHAHEHRHLGSDTDRRIALVGLDNAIEVCIEVYLNLHPRLRGGVEIPREEKATASANYHTKMAFLDAHIQARDLKLGTPIEAIIWYHSLRNELYHSGNGMVPEAHVVDGAASAAFDVFNALFGEDIRALLDRPPEGSSQPTGDEHAASRSARGTYDRTSPPPSMVVAEPAGPVYNTQNDQMEFLRIFIDFERAVQALTPVDGRRPAGAEWAAVVKTTPSLRDHEPIVRRARALRNTLVHEGGSANEDYVEVAMELMDITDALRRLQR